MPRDCRSIRTRDSCGSAFRRKIGRVLAAALVVATMAPCPPSRSGVAAPGPGPQAAQSPQASAPIDLTGYWVSIVNEDWRWRMVTPPKGDFASVPLNAEGRKVADSWDPSTDGSCLAYGAAGLMRMPTRLHITWENENTLKIDTDAGHADAAAAVQRGDDAARGEIAAGILARGVGARGAGRGGGGGPRRSACRWKSQGRDHGPDRWLAAEERRSVQRSGDRCRVLRSLPGTGQYRMARHHHRCDRSEVPDPGVRDQYTLPARTGRIEVGSDCL